jgi:UDP-N-acetylenolpyruvoylglucosamine reductase
VRPRGPESGGLVAPATRGGRIGYNTEMTTGPSVDLGRLRDAIAGDVVIQGDSGWDAARQAWNLAADQHPAVVVLAAGVPDIVATVRFARANGIRVAPQSTGHGATSLGDLAGTILLRTSRVNGVAVDPAAGTATAEAGARWHQVIPPAAEHGLVGLHGMSGSVGVAGYTLGGGIGWLSRSYGFASSHVRSLEVVTADGEQRHVDAGHERDLFWALRGGGGGQAIVTSIEFELFELREAFAGALMWPIERASEIVHAYREWTSTAPDAVTSTFKLVRFPPLPEVPDPLRGRELTAITLAFIGSESDGTKLVAPLRAIAAPYLDTLAPVPGAALGDLAGDPQDPLPGIGGTLLLDQFTAQAADAFVELAGPQAETPLTSLEIRHLGGALARATPDPSAAGPLEAQALVYGVGTLVSPEVGVMLHQALDAVKERLTPWTGVRGTLLTFDEQGAGLRGSFTPEIGDRLASVTAEYDPAGLFVANHVVD